MGNIGSGSVLITGSTGFIGSRLCSRMSAVGWTVREADRRPSVQATSSKFLLDLESSDAEWHAALSGVDCLIHLAARVHIMGHSSQDLNSYMLVNAYGTERLARLALEAGVKRFIFVSTVKVHGEKTVEPLHEGSPIHATEPYAMSKWKGELALRDLEARTGLDVVVLRPPLVYGPGVRANFLSLMKLVYRGVPLPFLSANNRRSFLYADNLVEVLVMCANHPAAAGQTFLLDDGESVSTPELIRCIARSLRKPAILFPFPITVLFFIAKILRKTSSLDRLIGSLEVDSSSLRQKLEWSPLYSMEEGLAETARWFMKRGC